MHRVFRLATCLIAGSVLLGCGHNDDDHEHRDHDHEHDDGGAETDSQGHAHAAKFGGTLVEIGDHFAQAEIVFDNEAGLLTVYFWDGHVESPRRMKAEWICVTFVGEGTVSRVNLAAQADALAGETVGNSSRFEAKIGFKGAKTLKGTITDLDFAGKKFTDVEFLVKAR